MSEENGQEYSLFVSETIHEREVALPDGRSHKMWFREVPAQVFRAFQIAETSSDDDKRVSSMFVLIAASVCEPNGQPSMTAERAAQLKPEVANAIMRVILDINRIGRAVKNG